MKNSFKKINSVFEVVEHEDKLVYTIKKQEEKIEAEKKRMENILKPFTNA